MAEKPAHKFRLGRLSVAIWRNKTKQGTDEVLNALGRHAHGDWGEVNEEDWEENEFSLREGFRLLSSYRSQNETKFWVITEHDRSVTTVLLPEEY